MPRFVNCRRPSSLAALSERQREQLLRVSPKLDGDTRDPEIGFGSERFRGLEIWEVRDDDDALRFEVWVHDVESGFAFTPDGAHIGSIVQFGFACAEDPEAWDLIAAAAAASDFGEADAGTISWSRDEG